MLEGLLPNQEKCAKIHIRRDGFVNLDGEWYAYS